ncbi:hypothetical protein LTR17_016550 [Elasticomyces elasticus]|nr:hypothetical protein LTR17_016550 [Elasticomyces elasticus]
MVKPSKRSDPDVSSSSTEGTFCQASNLSRGPCAYLLAAANYIIFPASVAVTGVRNSTASLLVKTGDFLIGASTSTKVAASVGTEAPRSSVVGSDRTSRAQVQDDSDDSPEPTSAKPVVNLAVPLLPIDNAQPLFLGPVRPPSISVRHLTLTLRPEDYDDPSFSISDSEDVQIDSEGQAVGKCPVRIKRRVARYQEMTRSLETWLIAAAVQCDVSSLPYYLTEDETGIRYTKGFEKFARAVASGGDILPTVREHVHEIVVLRDFVACWYEDIVVAKGLPENCGIAKTTKGHRAFHGIMVNLLEAFGGPGPITTTLDVPTTKQKPWW